MVLGILGITCILPVIGPILAMAFGIIALSQINKSRSAITGRGRAVAGLVLGCIGIVLTAILFSVIIQEKGRNRRVICMSNMKQIAIAIDMYAETHDGMIPKNFEDLRTYATRLDELLICPSAKDTNHPSYQIIFGGKRWNSSETADAVVMTESLSNHQGVGHNVLYGNGHVTWVLNQKVPD